VEQLVLEDPMHVRNPMMRQAMLCRTRRNRVMTCSRSRKIRHREAPCRACASQGAVEGEPCDQDTGILKKDGKVHDASRSGRGAAGNSPRIGAEIHVQRSWSVFGWSRRVDGRVASEDQRPHQSTRARRKGNPKRKQRGTGEIEDGVVAFACS